MISCRSLMLAILFLLKASAFSLQAPFIRPAIPSEDPFYVPPPSYTFADAEPGTLLRHRTTEFPLGLSEGITSELEAARQLMFVTTDSHGQKTAAVSTLLLPAAARSNSSLVSYQIAYDSSCLDCSPSYSILKGSNMDTRLAQCELYQISLALRDGYSVSVPDHEGLNCAFGAGPYSGMITLDALRAAQSFHSGLVSPEIVLWGYSGGTIASGWAAELRQDYAPELNIVGVALGGFIPDLGMVLSHINGGAYSGLIFPAVIGLGREYPEFRHTIEQELLESGQGTYKEATKLCMTSAITNNAFRDVFSYLKSGKHIMETPAVKHVLAKNTLGSRVPDMPLYIYHAANDEVTPLEPSQAVFKGYCAQGATASFTKVLIGSHASEAVAGAGEAYAWLKERLHGVELDKECTMSSYLFY